ncbi:hypothetical protein [Aquirufa ecclesiirivi]|uniref:hypothetical protein n=1 Tax=Aquirufa ecclesiirivi TaxID=2715124 RepID=UPI00140A6F02|nr:hypothetical protein [Aquirufa ecclesiirivi]NHC48182.1 hypothetical protein [Aquirufa ecclesiirivi]
MPASNNDLVLRNSNLHIPQFVPFFCLLAGLLFFSCSESVNTSPKNTYFAWADLLHSYIKSFEETKPKVHKTVFLDGVKEVKVVSDIDWAKEWALFLEADLNKPAFEKSYDNLSEPDLIWYSLKLGETLPVKKFMVHLDGLNRPTRVEIEVSQQNFLFETSKNLQMTFSDGHVQTYYIEGSQKLRWGKPTHYKLLGVLLSK